MLSINLKLVLDSIFFYFVIFISGLISGVINTLAGGGSFLTLPILIFSGLPPNVANGTNRLGLIMQSIFGVAGYHSKGISSYPLSIYLGFCSLVGALIGAQIAIEINPYLFNKILSVVMVTMVFIMLVRKKSFNDNLPERTSGKHLILSLVIFFFIGVYGGFINAGIGFIIMFFLNQVNRLNLVKTNATKVLLVLVYSSGALSIFAFNNAVDWKLGFILALGSSIGAWWASRWSVENGEGIVKLILFVAASILAVKLWFF
tara:strand:- start:9055 stop:9834 length:780 start_codon:yes stop_codon:yes gene_type:complete